ncbi:CHAP domain-containing protein [Candidatus Saccharibacteria bacterium]|nr:CHAP domain-containing protein [Candidatus Saccharibacteria bacterium]
MKALKTKTIKFFVPVLIFTLVLSAIFMPLNNAYADYAVCTSDACKAAQAAENELRQKAADAINEAQTVEGEIAKLDAEIAAIQANIDTSIAMVNELKVQIKQTEERLDSQQSGLASLLVQMHFDHDTDPISILASSKSLSDYAEKQARSENIKSQIAAGIEAIKELKDDLEGQKADMERLIEEQEGQRSAIAEKRAEQQEIANKYRDNAASFSVDADAKHQEMLAQVEWIRTQVQSSGNIGGPRTTAGTDTYPWRNGCMYEGLGQWAVVNWKSGGYGGLYCQCVDYAGWKVYEYTHGQVNAELWGNANMWASSARRYNKIWVDEIAAPNTVAVSGYGGYGHVMWVESVNPDGSLNITEYNYYPYVFSSGVVTNPSGLSYIHLDNYH